MTDARVLVGLHRVHARVAGDTRAGERTLLRAVAEGLSDALEEAPVGHGYWILRGLDVRSQLGATWTTGQMARALAHDISGAVAEVQARGVDPEHALWFPDRAAFLARFLEDLADGRARRRWEYADLGALLRPESALEELAGDEPDDLAAALVSLPLGVLEALARVTADEEAVLARFGPVSGPAAREPVFAAVRTLLAGGRRIGPLLLAVVAARDHGLLLATVRETAAEVAGVVLLAERGGPEAVAALRAADWSALTLFGDDFLPVVGWPDHDRERLADALDVGERPGSATPAAESGYTVFGGAFLLVPILDDLADWAEVPGADALRLLVLTAALGRGSSAAARNDPVLRDVYDLAADVDPLEVLAGPVPAGAVTVAEVTEQVRLAVHGSGPVHDLVAGTAAALLAALGRRLPGMAAASPAYLWANVLDIDARLTYGEGERHVELGHAPLGVLVSMTGLGSGTFRVRGHEEVRWTLTTAP